MIDDKNPEDSWPYMKGMFSSDKFISDFTVYRYSKPYLSELQKKYKKKGIKECFFTGLYFPDRSVHIFECIEFERLAATDRVSAKKEAKERFQKAENAKYCHVYHYSTEFLTISVEEYYEK